MVAEGQDRDEGRADRHADRGHRRARREPATSSRPGRASIGKVARGGNIPLEYYKDPEKTAETFVTAPDGTRYSIPGDFATVEADGTITLLGRGSVSINSGGEKIFPEEVEGAVKSHPDVYDCTVVGVPDERWGQRVAAVVQPRDGAEPTLESLQEHCRTQIAGYKVPRELHLVDAIERSPSGQARLPLGEGRGRRNGGGQSMKHAGPPRCSGSSSRSSPSATAATSSPR